MLYKQLNEQRTQGEWYVSESCTRIDTEAEQEDGGDIICKSPAPYKMSMKRWEPNAKYTCLAVNNLAEIADCLDWFIKHCEAYFPEFPLKDSKESEMLIKAKEALNRIS